MGMGVAVGSGVSVGSGVAVGVAVGVGLALTVAPLLATGDEGGALKAPNSEIIPKVSKMPATRPKNIGPRMIRHDPGCRRLPGGVDWEGSLVELRCISQRTSG